MKVVALVSGGKDSCYAMMRCLDYGHEIVALANLLPPEDSVDEMDSYMYQTVGHQIIEKYAECMSLPLYRRRIQGKARYQELRYKRTEGDEVEDLMILLGEVKKQIPEVGGVSSGAIASDYQRLRVESVCSRLGLVSLSFMWKQDQCLLLDEMISRGVQSILIKVAVIGLHPNKHLGKNLKEVQSYLLQLKEEYGINVCGEGGEYETLTLDCPLFKTARIVIDKFEIIRHSMDSFAPVGILHPVAFHLEPKENCLVPGLENDIADADGTVIYPVIEVEGNGCGSVCKFDNVLDALFPDDVSQLTNISCVRNINGMLSIGCCLNTHGNLTEGFKRGFGIILKALECKLRDFHIGWEDVVYVHVYLSEMKQFAVANEVYMTFIKEEKCPNGVPSRSTVEIPFNGSDLGGLYIEVLAAEDKIKKVLHVQSISCWAPSCIGPYSQATLHKSILYMAGQLGLDPPTMTVVPGGANLQMQQALKNCDAIARDFGCSLSLSSIIITVYCSLSLSQSERYELNSTVTDFLSQTARDGYNSVNTQKAGDSQPVILYVLVSALPKGALVEIKPLLYSSIPEADYPGEEYDNKSSGQVEPPEDSFCDESELSLLNCSSIEYPGRYCASIVTVPKNALYESCQQSSKDNLQDSSRIVSVGSEVQSIDHIARSCLRLFSRKLRKSSLCWENVLNFRVYFIVNVVPTNAMISTFRKAVETDTWARDAMLSKEQKSTLFSLISFIPVFGSGRDGEMSDLFTCELFACKEEEKI